MLKTKMKTTTASRLIAATCARKPSASNTRSISTPESCGLRVASVVPPLQVIPDQENPDQKNAETEIEPLIPTHISLTVAGPACSGTFRQRWPRPEREGW